MAQPQCYHKFQNKVQIDPFLDWEPCRTPTSASEFVNCCAAGDICLSDNLCQFTHSSNEGTLQSGYYVGGCTDKSWNDPSCNQHCGQVYYPDVTYNNTNNLWACCDTSDSNDLDWSCAKPSDDTWLGTPVQSLSSVARLASSSAGTATPLGTSSIGPASATAIATATATASSTSPLGTSSAPVPISSSNSELSGGAKAGIGVGVAIGVLAVAVLLILFLWRARRKAKRNGRVANEKVFEPYGFAGPNTAEMDVHGHPQEMQARDLYAGRPQEIGGNEVKRPPQELQGRAVHT